MSGKVVNDNMLHMIEDRVLRTIKVIKFLI